MDRAVMYAVILAAGTNGCLGMLPSNGLRTASTGRKHFSNSINTDCAIAEGEINNYLNSDQFTSTSKGSVWTVGPIPSSFGSRANYCFKGTAGSAGNSLHIKKTRDEVIVNGKHARLASDRLRYEFEGMEAFSKYDTANVIPEILRYDPSERLLITEWLDQYVPLRYYFSFTPLPENSDASGKRRRPVSLEIDGDVSRAMGTVMGRSHARTHSDIIPPIQLRLLTERFANKEQFDLWEEALFQPALRLLSDPSAIASEDLREIILRYNAYSDSGSTDTSNAAAPSRGDVSLLEGQGPLTDALLAIRRTYLEKKEALIHGGLHCNNVLMDISPNDNSRSDSRSQFKVVDFEKCAMGPAGLDLGMFLSNFLWYYPGHSESGTRNGWVSAALAVLDSYKQAFRVQITGAGGMASLLQKRLLSKTKITADSGSSAVARTSNSLDATLSSIFRDAMGFMGAYSLFMVLNGLSEEREIAAELARKGEMSPVEVLDMSDMPELQFGDRKGRFSSVRRRQLLMSVHALLLYYDSLTSSHQPQQQGQGQSTNSNANKGTEITAQSFASVFQADDRVVTLDHPTEFWY